MTLDGDHPLKFTVQAEAKAPTIQYCIKSASERDLLAVMIRLFNWWHLKPVKDRPSDHQLAVATLVRSLNEDPHTCASATLLAC